MYPAYFYTILSLAFMKYTFGKSFLLFFFALALIYRPVSAAENYKFRTMSPEGGFYYDGIKGIEQDKDGFIWIMMNNELYRFDGFEYKKYYPYFAAIDSFAKWDFHNMISDAQGNLYVNTGEGLFSYDRITDTFNRIFDYVVTVKADKLNNLWIFRDNNKWYLLDKETGIAKEPLFDGDSVSYMNSTICSHNADLYGFIHNKIYRYNPTKHEFATCLSLPQQDASIRFAYAHQGKLWVYTNQYGLYRIDLSTFHVEEQYGFIPGLSNDLLRRFFIDKKGYIWFTTMNGLYIFNPETREVTHYTHSETDPLSLPNNSIWYINEDRQGNVWLGMYSGKLCYVNIDETDVFKSFNPHNSKLSQVPVSSFAEDENYLWIGTEGGGLNRMDKKSGEITHIWKTYNNIKSMVLDSNRNLWMSMYMDGLACYQINEDIMQSYMNIRENPNSLLLNNIRKIVPEQHSGLWIAYQYNRPQVSYFAFDTQSFTHFDLIDDDDDSFIFDILKQGDKYLWAIANKYLYKLDTSSKHVERIMPNDSTYMGLYTFCLDDSGYIWIGTIGNGLIKFDPNNLTFVSMKDFLPSPIYSIYNICYDDGNVWMGTDNGLFCYNIAENTLLSFDKKEGTQGQVYYPLAAMKGKDGKLYFGGTDGFSIVNPKGISHNPYKPKVIISDFYIDHKPASPKYKSVGTINEIVLDYDQANFGFKFSSDNYHIPEKNLFKYRLRGYDENWIETNALNRIAMYSKVPAGTYHFEVYTANNDGVWGEIPTIIKIKRKPAPWFSWPAYIFYFLVVMGIAYTIIRYYNDKKKLKMQLYLENIEKEKKEQIHQTQLRFFTNISHDFRTPLSLIIAALDKLRKEGLKEYYYRILNGNSQRLLNLVNELMDFRTVENGKMKLALQPLSINNFIKDIAADFTDYAEQRHINFQVKCDDTLPAGIYVDKSIVEKIVMNLLNNAFKYSTNGDTIIIETRNSEKFASAYKSHYTVSDEPKQSDMFSIIVSDTGVGISSESISEVFERFYKVNTVNHDSHLGTGIGLALVKSLTLLHKGNITIYSERNQGTDMVVRFPLNKDIFAKADFLQQEEIKETTPAPQQLPATIQSEEEEKPDEENIMFSNKKKILIAEDNDDLRILIAESMADEFDITQAADGLQALHLISENDFDLIISDIMMPHKDGVSLCSDVKGDINTSHIPFILLTAKTSIESKIEGVGTGADMYFEKPIDLNYLKLSIQNIFKNQQVLKEYYAKNYYADSSELSSNEQDNKFLKKLTDFIEEHLDQSEMDVNLIASELSMSRSKLYTKVKSLTGKSIVEFVLNYRLRKAARLIIEENITMREVMMQIGIESQPYFTNSFKKMFGETPTSFASKHKKKK